MTNKLRDEVVKEARKACLHHYKDDCKQCKAIVTALLAFNGEDELPDCPICGKRVAVICPDDLKKLQDEGLRLEMLEGKMADGWCLVSPEDFERLRECKAEGVTVYASCPKCGEKLIVPIKPEALQDKGVGK